jgi:DtxR family Mn-dependent transcriptional regulator
MEDYLETISILARERKVVRVTQISDVLGVKKPSVTSALKKLREAKLIEHERYGYVELTDDGQRIADDVLRRHEILQCFLVEILGIDQERAAEDACKMEHAVSPVTAEKLSKFVNFVLSRPQGEPEWLKSFRHYSEHGNFPVECMTKCMREK